MTIGEEQIGGLVEEVRLPICRSACWWCGLAPLLLGICAVASAAATCLGASCRSACCPMQTLPWQPCVR